MNKRWNKLCVSALACMALVVPLTACEGQLPTPAADTSTKVAPDLTEAQEKKIRLKILKTIDEADQAKNPDGYATVMGGPQLDIRISQTTINQRGGGMSEYATIPKDIAQTVIPTDDGWPRSVFTITTTTEDQQSKRLLVFDQESAQQNYKLMAMARLFEGAKLPKFEIPTIGSQMGTAKDEKLVAARRCLGPIRRCAAERLQEPIRFQVRRRFAAPGTGQYHGQGAGRYATQQRYAGAKIHRCA